MANFNITGEAVRRAGTAGLRQRFGVYIQTGVDPRIILVGWMVAFSL